MFMARTPLRITFVGGGTDIPDYYRNYGHGMCVSAAINKYIYVMVNKKFDEKIRVSYSRTEIVDKVEEIEHPTVREALKLLDIKGGIEIVSISDIPSSGTGLGSSSTFLVSLLNALHAYIGEHASAKTLAEEAVKIERYILKEPGGKQDQYIAAYGGFRSLRFHSNEGVTVTPIIAKNGNHKEFQESLMLLYTGRSRRSADIHRRQAMGVSENVDKYKRMVEIAESFPRYAGSGNLEMCAKLMDENWRLKTKLADGISDPWIDEHYERALRAGALGGKLLGAGGGGFILLVVPKEKREEVKGAMSDLREEKFSIDFMGSNIIYVGE
ncbi:MAG: kinase [Candidatus Thermoplasmatota archaeon]|nr:kinase [Candidatus Thermoplasmatota archaeon]MCL5665519.1 kinase [Candidatus Thermoplasmatota archaeon]